MMYENYFRKKQHIAERAAQSGDLRSMHPADPASHANAQWDELRVWDPGD